MSRKTAEIRRLNDCFRKNPALLGRVMLTSNVSARGGPFAQKCLDSSYTTRSPTTNNDPYHEHDFGTFEMVSSCSGGSIVVTTTWNTAQKQPRQCGC